MKCLFISTYNELVTIGLLNDGKLICKEEEKSNKSHSTLTIPLINKVLNSNNMKPQDLSEIIVVNGPGSFTGVRLGITVAKTLAYTLNIPIKTITSIEALAVSVLAVDKIIVVEDSKGMYFGKFINNKLIDNISYLDKNDFNLYINTDSNKELLVTESINLNLDSIYEYCINIKPTEAHAVKAIYIKSIEVLNAK